jgi:hypothetical protein
MFGEGVAILSPLNNRGVPQTVEHQQQHSKSLVLRYYGVTWPEIKPSAFLPHQHMG